MLGSGYLARVFRQWALAEREPVIQPRIVVFVELMMVFQLHKSEF